MGKKSANKKSGSSAAHLGSEAKLWVTADKLRNNMDAAEYKQEHGCGSATLRSTGKSPTRRRGGRQ